MARKSWKIEKTADTVTVSRRPQARFDVFAETVMPAGRPVRLAHQIRQDMWRALQSLRGFSPVVEVSRHADGVHIKAGGEVAARRFPRVWAESVLADLLANPENRERWARFAALQKDTV